MLFVFLFFFSISTPFFSSCVTLPNHPPPPFLINKFRLVSEFNPPFPPSSSSSKLQLLSLFKTRGPKLDGCCIRPAPPSPPSSAAARLSKIGQPTTQRGFPLFLLSNSPIFTAHNNFQYAPNSQVCKRLLVSPIYFFSLLNFAPFLRLTPFSPKRERKHPSPFLSFLHPSFPVRLREKVERRV